MFEIIKDQIGIFMSHKSNKPMHFFYHCQFMIKKSIKWGRNIYILTLSHNDAHIYFTYIKKNTIYKIKIMVNLSN
jgi:hypothetical protein